MNKFHSIFNEINKYMKYMLYDDYIVFSSNYVVCMNKILYVLKNTLSKIQNIYFKYILHPKIKASVATVATTIP
jgi:hypothetical protein